MKLAIVGSGASALIMLSSVLRKVQEINLKEITIYSNAPVVGPGKAYQWDIVSPLMNLPNYSIFVDDKDTTGYVHWLKLGLNNEKNIHPLDYSSRRTFGRYLRYYFLKIIAKCELSGVKVEVIYTPALTIENKSFIIINKGEKSERIRDKVIICPGVAMPENIYGIENNKLYFHDPYPLSSSVGQVDAQAPVKIMGSGLTAVDIARALIERKHSGPITMWSRNGQLPRVRNARIVTRPIYVTPGYVSQLIKNKKNIKINDVYELIRIEFEFRGVSIKPLLRWFSMKYTIEKQLKWQMKLIESGYEGMELALNIIHPNLEKIWSALSEDEKVIFNMRWRSKFMCFMNPMPEYIAYKFHDAILKGQLQVNKISDHANSNHKNDMKSIKEGTSNCFVFNATPPSGKTRCLNRDSAILVDSLVNKNKVLLHPLGGIQIQPGTGAALSHRNLFLLGHITNGVYLLTNSLVAISRQANHIAQALIFNKD